MPTKPNRFTVTSLVLKKKAIVCTPTKFSRTQKVTPPHNFSFHFHFRIACKFPHPVTPCSKLFVRTLNAEYSLTHACEVAKEVRRRKLFCSFIVYAQVQKFRNRIPCSLIVQPRPRVSSCLTQSTAVPKGNVAKEVQVLTIIFFRCRNCCMKQEEVTNISFVSVSSRNELAKYSHT